MPGNDERKVSKAAGSLDVDVVCMDMEDAVAVNKKEEARQTIARLLPSLDFGRSERAVRINPPFTREAEADISIMCSPQVLPQLQALVVPKVTNAHDIDWLFERVRAAAGSALGEMEHPPALITMCESAAALLELRSSIEACRDAQAPLRHEAVILGGDDYVASIHAERTHDSRELLLARQQVVVHCRAFGLQPIDIVNIHFHDITSLQHEAREGRQLGFEGKQIIHPSQVGPVQTAFSPSEEQIKHAKELLHAFEVHQRKGQGAFTFHNKMIDNPSVLQAKNLLDMAARC